MSNTICKKSFGTFLVIIFFFTTSLFFANNVLAATEVKKPSAETDPGGVTTTNVANAYDTSTAGDATTFSTTVYGQGGTKISLYHNFGAGTQTYSALSLKLKYSAQGGTNDTYRVQYSTTGLAACTDYATRTWTDLVPASSAAASLVTNSATLSTGQNLTQLCVKYLSTKTGASDNKNFDIYDIWTEGTYTALINTTTTVSSNNNPAIYGTSITFTATVTPASGGAPTGTVTFKEGVNTIGSGTLNGANPGVATYSTSTLSVSGSPYSITASYGGDGTRATSVSSALAQTINKANQAALILVGQTVSQPAVFAALSTTGGSGTGAVTYAVTTAGTAGCSIIGSTLSYTNAGTCGVTATKAADTNYNAVSSTEATFTIIAPATKFVITSASNGTIDMPSYVTIQAQNSSSGLVTTYNNDVTLVTDGSATGGGLVDIINGVGTTTISDEVVESVHLSLSDTQSTGLDVTSTADIYFGPGNTATLSITASSTSVVAGELLPVTISRADRLDNSITAGSETFYLYSDSSGTNRFYDAESGGNIISTVLITDGSSEATAWYYDELVGTPIVTVSDNSSSPDGDTGVNDGSININVTSAPTSAFLLSDPGNLTAGERLEYQVSRQDQFGNFSDNGSVDVYLYHTSASSSTKFYDAATDGNIIDSITISSGVASSSFWLYAEKVSSFSVTVSDNNDAPDGTDGINDASDNVTINSGSVGIFTLNNPGDMTASTTLGYTVSRSDDFGNPVAVGDLTVYLYSDPEDPTNLFYDMASGGNEITSIDILDGSNSADFWFYSETPGDYDIIASDNSSDPDGLDGINDATDSVTVLAIPVVATRFVIQDTIDTVVGGTAEVTIRAEDNSGNVDTGYNGSVTLHTSGSATAGGIVTIASGVGTINIIDTVAEVVDLSLADTGGSGLDVSSTNTITFYPGPTASYIINSDTASSTISAGNRAIITVTRKDQYGNTVTSGVDTVYFYNNAPSGTSAFYNSSTEGSQISSALILNNSSSVDVWFTSTKAGSWTVSGSDNATAPDVLNIADDIFYVDVNPSDTARLTLNDPGDMFNGTRLMYTATRYDAYNNLVTSGSESYYLHSNATGTSTAFYDVSVGGTPISSISFEDGQSTLNFWYYELTNGTWTVYISDNSSGPDGSIGIVDGEDSVIVSAIPIVATKFIIVTAIDTALVGNPIAIEIRAVDNDNNIDTTYQNDVTLNASGLATGDGLIDIVNGVGQVNINDIIAETVSLTLTDTQLTGLNVSSGLSIIFSITPIISGGGGGTPALITPAVFVLGRAFPQAGIEIMAIQNGQVPIGSSQTGMNSGNFNVVYGEQLPSTVKSFAIVVYDKDQNIAQTKIMQLGVNDTLFANILMAPTIYLKQDRATLGSFLGVTGKGMPGYKIELTIDGVKIPEEAIVGTDGSYNINFNTYRLGLGEHTLRVRQVNGVSDFSDYSIEKRFSLVKLYTPRADLNSDGKVDIADWSIFMTRYQSKDSAVRQSIDINSDGLVDPDDIIVFLKALTQ